MQRLTGLDATFLYMETPTSPMHVSSVFVLDPSTSPDAFDFDKLRSVYAKRLHLAPPFRRRLVEVPFALNHPVWIEDPDFDLDWHVRHIAVPKPGTMAELEELVSHLIAMPLDRSRPLWEVWLIDGLEGGYVAVLSKVHHAAIDGASGEELMVALLDITPEMEDKPDPGPPWKPDKVPTDTELVGYALASLAQTPLRAVKTARRTIEAALRIRGENRQPDVTPPPSLFSAPNTSFNAALSPHRTMGTATLSLPDVKRMKNAFGVKVNDVVLALCAGALRSYLDHHDEHPDGPLVAMVPMSVRSDEQKGSMGNQVSSALATLATDIDDPVERLMAIHDGMNRAKEQQDAIGADTLQNWVEFAAPAVFNRAVRLYSRMKMADRHRPLFNVTISNVPGPPFPLYIGGARVVASYPLGPIFDGGGLNMTVMSYMDSLDFGLNADPELIPDIETLSAGLHASLEELKKAADDRVHHMTRRASTLALAAACLLCLLGAGVINPDNEPLPVPGTQNGYLPGYVLAPVSSTCVAETRAAYDLRRLLSAATAAGVRLTADECYRDFAGQVFWRNYYCSIGQCQLAAVPGTSMHGWGKAVDFGDGTDEFKFSSPAYRWLKANAARFNFNHPGWAEPGTGSEEPWHWEWLGDGGVMFGRTYAAVASKGEAARNADGRLEIFGVGADQTVRHLWQQAGSPNGWSPVLSLGGSVVTGSLQVINNADGRLEVFGTDADNHVLHAWQVAPNSAWSGFTLLGDRPGTPPAIGRNDDGRLEVFSVDATGALWHAWQVAPNSGWSAPEVFGTGFVGSPGLTATDDGRLTVFGVGADGSLRGTAQMAPNSAWSPMVTVASNMKGRPAVGINIDGRIEVFSRGTDNRLWHSWQASASPAVNLQPLDMSPAQPLEDRPLGQAPTVGRNPDGRLEVFAIDSSGHLGHAWQAAPNGGWSGWEVLSTTPMTGTPTLAMNYDGRLEIFSGTAAPAVWNNWQVAPSSPWAGFQQLATGLGL